MIEVWRHGKSDLASGHRGFQFTEILLCQQTPKNPISL